MTTYEMQIEITTSNARPSTTVDTEGAWDVDVELEIGGRTGRKVTGEVTLCPRDFDGQLAAWGEDINTWMSSDLVAVAYDLTADGRRALCREIEADSVEAIEGEIEAGATNDEAEAQA